MAFIPSSGSFDETGPFRSQTDENDYVNFMAANAANAIDVDWTAALKFSRIRNDYIRNDNNLH